MPLNTPAPRVLRRWRTEDREEVPFGIAHKAIEPERLRVLDGREDFFELHDLSCRHVAALAQAGLEQIVCKGSLRMVHLADGQTVPWEDLRRNEIPVRSLFTVEGERRPLPLLTVEALQKPGCGSAHCRRRRPCGYGEAQCGHDQDRAGHPSTCHRNLHPRLPCPAENSTPLCEVA